MIRYIIIILNIFFFYLATSAQSTSYHDISNFQINHYSTENGLPQNSISESIMPDKDGFIWMGTQSGIIKYDGHSIKIIDPLKDKRIHTVYEENGCVKAFHGDEKLLEQVFNSCSDTLEFKTINKELSGFFLQNCNCEPPKENSVTFFRRDKYFWHLRNDSLQYYYINEQKEFKLFKNKIQINPERPTKPEQFGFIDGNLFRFYLNNERKQLEAVHFSFDESKGVIEEIMTDVDIQFPVETEKKSKNLSFSGKTLLRNYRYYYLLIDNHLYRIEKDQKQLKAKLLVSNFNKLSDVDLSNQFLTIYSDEPGDLIFIGTYTEGVYELKRKNLNSYFSNKNSYSLIQLDSESLLRNGLYDLELINIKKNTTKPFYLKRPQHQEGIVDPQNIRSPLLKDSQSRIWTYKHGHLLRIDFEKGVQKIILKDSLSFILTLAEGKDKKIWVGGITKFGFIENDTYHSLNHLFPNGLKKVRYIAEDHSGNILIVGEGIYIYNPTTKKITTILKENVNAGTVYVDQENIAWIGTYGRGFFRYSEGKLVKLPNDIYDYLNYTHCFLEDENGFLWITTNKGLFKVKKETLSAYAEGKVKEVYYYHFDDKNGLSTSEFNGVCTPSGIKIEGNSFAFPSIKGIVHFDPKEVSILLPRGEIFIENFTINGEKSSFEENLLLPPDFKNISFSVTTPYFGNEQNLQLSYRIKGFSDNWQDIARNEKIQITSLSHGAYSLEVRYFKGFGINDYETLNLPFRVKPFFFQTPLFYILGLLGLLLLGYLIYSWRLQNIYRKNEKLKETISEKTLHLEKAIDKIEAKKLLLEKDNLLKSKLISIITHNLNGPIKFIGSYSYSLKENAKKTKIDELEHGLETIGKTSNELYQLTSNILNWVSSQKIDSQLKFQQFKLKEVINDILLIYTYPLESKSISVDLKIESDMMYSEVSYIKLIFQNIIHNACKFTPQGGKIGIKEFKTKEKIVIQICNTGSSISDERIKQILTEVTYPSFSGTKGESGQGLGVLIVRELLRKIGGKLAIDNSEENRTVFEIEIPNTSSRV